MPLQCLVDMPAKHSITNGRLLRWCILGVFDADQYLRETLETLASTEKGVVVSYNDMRTVLERELGAKKRSTM